MRKTQNTYYLLSIRNTMPKIDYGRFGITFPALSIKYILVVEELFGNFKAFAESTKGVVLKIESTMLSGSAVFNNFAEVYPYTHGRVTELLGMAKDLPITKEESESVVNTMGGDIALPPVPVNDEEGEGEVPLDGSENSTKEMKKDIGDMKQSIELTKAEEFAGKTVEELVAEYEGVIKFKKKNNKAVVVNQIIEYLKKAEEAKNEVKVVEPVDETPAENNG